MLYPSFSAVTSPQGHPDLPLHNEQNLSSPCPDANTRHGSVVTGYNYFICFPQWQELHLFFDINEQSPSWHLTHDGDALYSCLCCLGMDGRVISDSTYKDAHQPHLLLPSPEQWHPMNHQQVLQKASLSTSLRLYLDLPRNCSSCSLPFQTLVKIKTLAISARRCSQSTLPVKKR